MNYTQRKYSIGRWEEYDEKYWATQDEMCEFFNLSSKMLLFAWIRKSKIKLEDKVVIRGNYCLHLYNRQQLLRLIHDNLFRRKRTRGKSLGKLVKSLRNKDRYISFQDACALYGISPGTLTMRIARWDKEVKSVSLCNKERVVKGMGGAKRYFDKKQLEEAMNYFNQRKYSVSGRISVNKQDRHIVDVLSSKGSGARRAAQELGYDHKELYD